MTEIQIKNLIKEYEKEYIEFMEIEKLPQYKIDFFEINVEESDAAGFASAAQAYYNTKTDEHILRICKSSEIPRYIVFHEFTHILDTEMYAKQDSWKYMALSGYTEYHAAQVELMIMLGADSIQTQDFSFTVDVEIGNSTVRNYLNSRHQLVVNMMNRTDFPRDIEALKTTVGVLYNYFGVRSICKMYAKDYTEEVDNTIIIQKLSKVLFEEINSFMVGWFNEAQVELSFVSYMKIKSAVISIVVIAVLLLAILIGVKNGTLDKLTKEMPTLATNQAETEKATVNARNNSTESKPYDGIEVAEYGEEFVIRRKIDGRKYDENDRTTYNIYHVKVNDCKISRQCDFDINRLDFGLDNKKKSLDENNNFISDFYYATVELEITKDIDDNDVMDYMNVFQTTWSILKLNSDGTTQSFKTSACVGSDAETNQIGKTNFSFEKGETRTLTLYYILSDEEVENDKLVISFSLKNSPFIGPLAIVHEP